VKRDTRKVHLTEQVPVSFLQLPGTVANNAFNNFSLTVTKSLNLHKMGKDGAISFLKDAFPAKFPGIKIIPTTETEIKRNHQVMMK
jgi:hypothetical protein